MNNKYDFLILGADGMQGKITARYLLEKNYKVFLADLYKTTLNPILKNFKNSQFEFIDLRDIDQTVKLILKTKPSVVINCAEADWNLNVYKACLKTKTHCIDLGSSIEMTKKQLEMDDKFKQIKKIAITGCGSVPGIGNIMINYAIKKFDSINTIHLGFAWDSNIKKFVVPFSIDSVINEFTAPAPYIQNGRFKTKKPLKTITTKNYKLIGAQNSFIVHHSETYTLYYYYQKYGLKNVKFFAGFPNHSIEKILALIELGFDKNKPIKIEGVEIKPIDFLVQFTKRLKMPKGYTEQENIWAEIQGKKNKKKKIILMECLVPPLAGWEDAGCNIDTGIPAGIIAEMIKNKKIKKYGSFAPEAIVPEKEFFKELKKYSMTIYENGQEINL
ncbi:MAG: saccharopine dehydrogenase family protein [Minisyncoccia bacterium]